MRRLGEGTRVPARVYLVGGATAVLEGWRSSTIDIDLRFDPETSELFAALPALKESLDVNIELAWPSQLIAIAVTSSGCLPASGSVVTGPGHCSSR